MSNTIIYDREKCLRKEKLSFFYYFHVTETLITHDITSGINDISLTLCHKFNAAHVRAITEHAVSLLNMADEGIISPTTNNHVFSQTVTSVLSVDHCFVPSWLDRNKTLNMMSSQGVTMPITSLNAQQHLRLKGRIH